MTAARRIDDATRGVKSIRHQGAYRWIIFGFLCSSFVAKSVAADAVVLLDDTRENRPIPVAIYEPSTISRCTIATPCAVALVSAGYGVAHTQYRFIAEPLLGAGYLVVAVGHELAEDPSLAVTDNLFESRQENWYRGVANLQAVQRLLQPRYPSYRFDTVTLVGHSNGGDIAAWYTRHYPEKVEALITLDHRRVPLPRGQNLPMLSIRAGDFPADPGVIPEEAEPGQHGTCIVKIPAAKHNEMFDLGPEWLKRKIRHVVGAFVGTQRSCAQKL